MRQHDSVIRKTGDKVELGTVLCVKCGEVLYTLPTSGVKKLYGVCNGADCTPNPEQGGKEK